MTASPRGTFSIVQHYGGDWKQVLRFADRRAHAISLEEHSGWPALYYVSPDERWVLRVQKSGSGGNIAFLYHVDLHKQLLDREQLIGEQGLAFLRRESGAPQNLYHTGIEFKAWDLKAGRLHFKVHGSDADRSGNGINRSLTYGLRDGTLTAP